jgi:mannose-6-phosphate isomerase-like protein (cupin superfamily)
MGEAPASIGAHNRIVEETMHTNAYALSDLVAELQESDERYLEFLRVPALSVGLYMLPAGASDPQKPHTEDEVYHVVGGKAKIRVGGEDRPLASGSIVFVKSGVEHRFHSIEEDLTVLVFFAPAEGTNAA